MHYPRIIIAALKGGSGKTILSLGLTSAWREQGRVVAPFKKGPDFIDAGWLDFAAGRPCYNLDPFLMSEKEIRESFFTHSSGADISLIEGNRGLYDGLDIDGCCSTSELGKMLKAPVIIIADVTMSTRTIAAVILGCQRFDPDLSIEAVILNRVAGARQENLIRDAVERYCGIPVIGAVPKLKGDFFPERHMGLVPHQERERARRAMSWARKTVEDHLDLETIWHLAQKADPLEGDVSGQMDEPPVEIRASERPRIGYIKDSAFWFYYPENLDQLKTLGAELLELNAIEDRKLPDLDALYIGGGFPETQAKGLAQNRSFRDDLKGQIESGLPVYAECGGFMYLGNNIVVNDNIYPMVGAL
ncbi:MAG: cobyrinate a,c-diamide synthase, partial [Deltaproteobacteria bacterium]|nr:cobyrinate a,c-diamide synthase [Deltaproteobacteria bacterium]